MRVLMFGILMTCLAPVVIGQGVSISPKGVKLIGYGKVDTDKTVEHWAERERAAITGKMNLQVELLRDVCELDEKETTKLRLADQGIASRRLVSGRKQIREFVYSSGLAAPAPDDVRATEQFDDRLTPFKATQVGDGVVGLQARFERPISELPLWKKMLRSSLSDTQWEKYEAHCRQRGQMFVAASTTRAIAELDGEVFLNAKQRDSIRSHVIEKLESKITIDRPSSMKQARELTGPWFATRANLKNFLRPDQLQRLREIDAAQSLPGGTWSR